LKIEFYNDYFLVKLHRSWK